MAEESDSDDELVTEEISPNESKPVADEKKESATASQVNTTLSAEKEAEISRYDRIMRSIQTGHHISKVSIPSYYQAEDYTVFEVEVSNKKIRWNVWHRFDSFYMLHHMLLEIATSLSQSQQRYIVLPPFPEKHIKYVVDHFDREFIENRRMLLENYIKRILTMSDFKHSSIVTSFFTPDIDEIVLPPSSPGGRTEPINLDEILNKDDEDEITRVGVPMAQILKNDHAIFTVNCTNENKRKSFGEWSVLKRFAEFHAYDIQLRNDLSETNPNAIQFLPGLPGRSPKLLIDHLEESFIERRRILLEAYCKRLIRHPIYRKHPLTLRFFGVDMH